MSLRSQRAANHAHDRIALSVELDDYQEQFRRIKERAQRLVVGLNDRAFNWRPEPRRWSISECLDHLNLTTEQYLQAIDQAIGTARSKGLLGDHPRRRSCIGNLILRVFVERPARPRFAAAKKFVPSPNQSIDKVVPKFTSLQGEMLKRLQLANGLDLWRTKLRCPDIPLLKFSLGETFAIHAAHERRHLCQAEQLRGEGGFPDA